jgi:hypothetical protein
MEEAEEELVFYFEHQTQIPLLSFCALVAIQRTYSEIIPIVLSHLSTS